MCSQAQLFDLATPSMPEFDMGRCAVRVIGYDTAKSTIIANHYSHRCPCTIVLSVGLYVDDVLAGCLAFGIPPTCNVQRACGKEYQQRTLELSRLFVFDWAGRNSESYLVGRALHLLRIEKPQYCVVVSYADPLYGHVGTIYQATNWLYTGTGGGGLTIIDGKLRHPKGINNRLKTHSTIKLEKMGHTVERLPYLPKHRYVCFLGSKKQRKELRAALRWPVLPYPKQERRGNDE